MAKPKAKKKTTTVITDEREIDSPETGAEVAIPEADVDTDDLDALLGLADGGEQFTVHKEPGPGGKRPIYCARYSRSELSLDVIRDSFGGGDYRITGFDAQNKLTTSKRVTIIDMPKPKQELLPRDERPRESATESLLMQMIKSQGDMVAALVSRPPVPAPTGPTVMELVHLIKSLTPQPGKDPTEILLEGLKMGQAMGGGDDSVMGLAKSAIEALPLLAQKGPPRPAPPQPVPTLPAATTAAPTHNGAATNGAAPKDKPVDNVMKQLEWMRGTLAQLTLQASRKKDPELYADVFLDNIPDFIEEAEVYRRFAADDSLADLFKIHPAAKQFEPWFKDFRQCVLDSFGEDEETDTPTPPSEPEGGETFDA